MTGLPRVMIVAQPTAGGTARHVAELAVGCRTRAIDVHLVCGRSTSAAHRRFVEELRARDIPVEQLDMDRELSPGRDALAAMQLRHMITQTAPHVVHLHSSKAGALGRMAVIGLRRRPAVVYTPHAYAFLAQPGTLQRHCYRWLERAMAPWVDRIVAVSSSEAQAAACVGCGARVVVVPNGVAAHAAARRHETAPLRIGWLGRMTWQKNAPAAVTASLVLAKLGIEHELWMGGEGSELEHVRAAIVDAGASWIQLLGHVVDTHAFYEHIDLLLNSSRAEGLPYVGLDAMARGLPIVGFDVPGVRDLVEHGTTGFLAPAGDPGALAALLARLARSADLRRTMGEAARRRVREGFQLERQLDCICELYRELTTRSHRRAA